MKKKILVILLISVLFIFVGVDISNAAYTEQYERYIELSDEEKADLIEPRADNINIKDGIKASNQRKYEILKETLGDKYFLSSDIELTVKDQKNTNSCWTFVTTSSLESNISLKTKKTSPLYSTRHMEYATSKTFLDGINARGFNREVGDGGDYRLGFAYLVNGQGPVLASKMPFENNENKINLSEINKTPDIKVTDYAEFPGVYKEYDANGKVSAYTNGYTGEYKVTYASTNGAIPDEVTTLRTAIKEHIKENGGLGAYTYINTDEQDSTYYNSEKVQSGQVETFAYYCNDPYVNINHAITLVGWDDTYPKENFKTEPKNNGAYIALNSWGDEILNEGYFYISYDDALVENALFGVVGTSEIDYDTIYQHDEFGETYADSLLNENTNKEIESIYAANVFEKDETNKPNDDKNYDEYLNQISLYVAETSDIEIYINSDSDDLSKIEKVATPGVLEPGYHTVEITPTKLTGDKFIVAARYSSQGGVDIPYEMNYLSNGGDSNYWDVVKSNKGESYVSPSGNLWTDINDIYKDTNLCIKAFTTFEEVKDINVESVSLNETKKTMQVGDTASLVAAINPTNATNQNVTWYSSDEKVATVSEKGIITAIKEGSADITVETEDGEKTATCKVTVTAKTNTDDDKYKTEDSDDTTDISSDKSTTTQKNTINGKTTTNTTTNTTANTNTNTIAASDTTVSSSILPYTGKIKLVFLIVLILSAGIIILIKYRKMKDIK